MSGKTVEQKQQDKVEDLLKSGGKEGYPTLAVMSNEDAYIANRIKSQPKTLEAVLTVKERKYRDGEHRLSLPPELVKFQDRVTFRWVNKKKRSLDDAIDVKGWTILTRALFPGLPEHLFNTSGGIERGDAVLCFMSKKKADRIKEEVFEKSQRMKDANPMLSSQKLQPLKKEDSGLYRPEATSANKDTPGITVNEDGDTIEEPARDF